MRRRSFLWTMLLPLPVALLVGCWSAGNEYFARFDPERSGARPGCGLLMEVRPYQAYSEYHSGPAVLISLLSCYGVSGIRPDAATEERLAAELGTRGDEAREAGGYAGTSPEEMKSLLEKYGLQVQLDYEDRHDGSALTQLRTNLRNRIPTPVKWVDRGGQWALAVGYDDRGTPETGDDVLILIDPVDRGDDCRDGYTVVNAERFYAMWFDVSGPIIRWRPMLTVTPPGRAWSVL